ncbi:MAG: MmcQ/YjbR family DNA-binding protein [Fimbriimonas sp.]
MTYEDVVRIGRGLPDVEKSTSYGDPSLKRKGRLMLAMKQEGAEIAVKVDWDSHDRYLESHPDLVYKTDHYEGYPMFLVRLESLKPALAEELARTSW